MAPQHELDDDRDRNFIQSVSRAVAVLQAINRHGALGLTQIARAADIPYPTASRIVNTLVGEGLIEREPARKRYRPTALIQTLSCGFQNHDRLIDIAQPLMAAFTREHDWPLTLVTRVGDRMVVRASTSTQTSLTFTNYYPGWQVPLLASASGQVYLAFSDAVAQAELLRQSRAQDDPQTALLRADFETGAAQQRIREQGFASVARTAYSANPGRTSSLAVPLFDGEHLLGSLALVYFANAMPMAQAVGRFLTPLMEVASRVRDGMAVNTAPEPLRRAGD